MTSGESDEVRRVVIIGAGLAGTATAVRILMFAREPLEVVIVERIPNYRSAGVAYHKEGNPWTHVFNIQAGRMSLFREHVDDFIIWANSEADRSSWPDDWKCYTFEESGPAPRRIYQDYLRSRLARAATEAESGVTVREVDGEVVDLRPFGGPYIDVIVKDRDGNGSLLRACFVVVATGTELADRRYADGVSGHDGFIPMPYESEAIERLKRTPTDSVVAIVGSLLSAYDVANLLLRQRHRGKIHFVSGSGNLLRTYPADHTHQVVSLPRPLFADLNTSDISQLLHQARKDWKAASDLLAIEQPALHPDVVPERIMKAWEPHLTGALEQLSDVELQRLLAEYGSAIATARVGAMPYTTGPVIAAMLEGSAQLEVVVGRITSARPSGDGKIDIKVEREAETRVLTVDLVVGNFGREPDYAKVRSELWGNLLLAGHCTPHDRTRRGVEVDSVGRLRRQDGLTFSNIATVGAPREGDEVIRFGRLGAFSFNLAAIKNHSVQVGALAVRTLENPLAYEREARVVGQSPLEDPADEPLLDEAIGLEVSRMAEVRLARRRGFAVRLNECLGELARLTDTPSRGDVAGVLYRYVSEAAVEKMCDISVTPRRLRSMLGVEGT